VRTRARRASEGGRSKINVFRETNQDATHLVNDAQVLVSGYFSVKNSAQTTPTFTVNDGGPVELSSSTFLRMSTITCLFCAGEGRGRFCLLNARAAQ